MTTPEAILLASAILSSAILWSARTMAVSLDALNLAVDALIAKAATSDDAEVQASVDAVTAKINSVLNPPSTDTTG